MTRVALVEESWQKPISKLISAATLALQPAGTETLTRAKKGALLCIEWSPDFAFEVEISGRRSSHPNCNDNKANETDFTG